MGRSGVPALSLAEWLVLCLVDEEPTHGFAIASATGPEGELGRVWSLRRAVVYRGLRRLLELGLVAEAGVESTPHGPARTVMRATPEGNAAVRRWLTLPVAHVRDVRSELMVKLALLDRAGADPTDLLTAQRRAIEPIAGALRADRDRAQGFDRTLAGWRYETTVATLAFLDEVLAVAR
ncbi:helix-turn-helix transcriptional regulator [Actinomadura sp. DC4]|uniref:helix-turn-helix transcriptional regulator n=1 Tax=Actinomadura sp. DC4 TaxID=3055069 RepID=UPI0025B0627D|nr:helix-turn-helix transcriptional regulator [Actinomadura sp. DC4]MDN3354071.1 helix-turn-helix transcriptional regulator [Actinomadura sp. DC4]